MGRCKQGQSSVGTSNQYPIRANWKNQMLVDLFIDLCVDEVSRHGKNGEYLHIHSWSNIKKGFEEKNIFTFSTAELKNQWNVLKSTYNEWLNLLASASDYKYWSYKKWTQYVKGKRGAAQFRGRSLPHEEKMKFLFHIERPIEVESDDSMESSQMNTDADDSPEPPSPDETSLPNDEEIEENHHHSDEEGSASLPCNEPVWIDFINANTMESSQMKTGTNDSPKSSPVELSYARVESSQMKTHTNSINSQASSKEEASLPNDTTHKKMPTKIFNGQLERVLNTMKRTDEEATIEECNKVLDGTKKLEMGSTLYIAACAIFCESQVHRQQWMMLSKKPEEKHLDVAAQLRKLKVVHRMKVKQLAQNKGKRSSASMHPSQKSTDRNDFSDPVSETSLQNDDGDKAKHAVKSNREISPSYTGRSPLYSPCSNKSYSPCSIRSPSAPYAHYANNRSYSSYGRTSPPYSPTDKRPVSSHYNGLFSSPSHYSHGRGSPWRARVKSPQRKTHTNSSNPRASSEEASLPNDRTRKRNRSINTDDQLDQQERGLKAVKRLSNEEALEECNRILKDTMKKVELDDALYVAACAIFCESQVHREQWMMLSEKSVEIRHRWILMVAKRLGLV